MPSLFTTINPQNGVNRRQGRTMTLRCSLYKPGRIKVDRDTQLARDLSYPPSPTYQNVPFYIVESQESNVATEIGRSNYDIALTIDEAKFVQGQEIEDGWLVIVTSEGDSKGQCYVVQGGAQDKGDVLRRRAHQRRVFLVKTPTPKTAESGMEILKAPTPEGFGLGMLLATE